MFFGFENSARKAKAQALMPSPSMPAVRRGSSDRQAAKDNNNSNNNKHSSSNNNNNNNNNNSNNSSAMGRGQSERRPSSLGLEKGRSAAEVKALIREKKQRHRREAEQRRAAARRNEKEKEKEKERRSSLVTPCNVVVFRYHITLISHASHEARHRSARRRAAAAATRRWSAPLAPNANRHVAINAPTNVSR
jgi:hypothetical protein